jgi:hypothetical protein
LHTSGEENAGPSTAIGAKYAPIAAQDDSLVFDDSLFVQDDSFF